MKLNQCIKQSEISGLSVGTRCVPLVLVVALGACGGSATTLPSDNDIIVSTPVPVAAPALDTTAPTGSVPEPQPIPAIVTTPEVVPEEVEVPYTVDQEVLDQAASLGCEVGAEMFSVTMLELINASRNEARMCGVDAPRNAVSQIGWNLTLTQVAQVHADDMARNNFFSHTGSDGLSVSDRADAASYYWRAIGENIAAGQIDLAEVHQGWIDSPGHCKNIMNDLYTEVGAVCVRDPSTDFGTYWVVVFGDSK